MFSLSPGYLKILKMCNRFRKVVVLFVANKRLSTHAEKEGRKESVVLRIWGVKM
jgi:hypothetical protein